VQSFAKQQTAADFQSRLSSPPFITRFIAIFSKVIPKSEIGGVRKLKLNFIEAKMPELCLTLDKLVLISIFITFASSDLSFLLQFYCGHNFLNLKL